MTLHRAWIAVLALLASPVMAQKLTGVSAAPASVKPGETVTVTARLDISAGLNCSLRVHFGDGRTENVKINQEKDANYVLTHRYDKPGTYTVMVEPKTALPVLKCVGDNQRATVTVAAPPPAPAAAVATATTPPAGGSACPSGWTLVTSSVNKKSGAFECRAKPGTAPPAGKLDCPGQLGYYENTKTGRLGCRP